MLVAKLVPRFPRTNFRPRHDNTLNIVLGGGTWGRRHLGNPKLVLERDVDVLSVIGVRVEYFEGYSTLVFNLVCNIVRFDFTTRGLPDL